MSTNDDYPRAIVREVDGRLVLDDPDARAVIRAVECENIRRLLIEAEPRQRIQHFAGRIAQRNDTGLFLMIVMLCVDDPKGAALANVLMPGYDWASIRARGEIPWARGLATRAGIQELLDGAEHEAAAELRAIAGIAVLAIDRGIVTVFDGAEFAPETVVGEPL